MSADGDPYLPLRSLAVYSGLSVRTLRGYLVHRGAPLPHFRVGGKILVRRSDFDTWVRRFRVEAVSAVEAIAADVLAGL